MGIGLPPPACVGARGAGHAPLSQGTWSHKSFLPHVGICPSDLVAAPGWEGFEQRWERQAPPTSASRCWVLAPATASASGSSALDLEPSLLFQELGEQQHYPAPRNGSACYLSKAPLQFYDTHISGRNLVCRISSAPPYCTLSRIEAPSI